MREIAPSSELRKWFAHDPERWQEFRRRYRAELRDRPGEVERLRVLAHKGTLTLLFSASDATRNNAVVLRDVLLGRSERDQSVSGITGGAKDGN